MKYLHWLFWSLSLLSLFCGSLYLIFLLSFPSANHGVFLTFQILTLFFLSAAVAVFCCFIN